MTTMAGSILLKRKAWAFIPVFFLLSNVPSDGFPDASKSGNGDIAPKALEVLAQGDPQKSAQEEKSRTPSRTSQGDSDKKAGPEKSKEPAPPFEDFVPSEKIDADKAVDFPVDI